MGVCSLFTKNLKQHFSPHLSFFYLFLNFPLILSFFFINRLEVILVGVMHFGWRQYWCFHLLFWDLLWSHCSWKVRIFISHWFIVVPWYCFSSLNHLWGYRFCPRWFEESVGTGDSYFGSSRYYYILWIILAGHNHTPHLKYNLKYIYVMLLNGGYATLIFTLLIQKPRNFTWDLY